MRAVLAVLFLFFVLGAGPAVFETYDPQERRFDATVALIGFLGLCLMGFLQLRRVGTEQFLRELGVVNADQAQRLLGLAVYAVVLPVLTYLTIVGIFHIADPGAKEWVGATLAVLGFGIAVKRYG
jgi:hypothetical protein